MVPSAASLCARYRELAVPVTIIAGSGDAHALPRLHSQRLHEDVPHSQLFLLPEVGHMVHHTMPKKVFALIDQAAQSALTQAPAAKAPFALQR